jgi:hypothetical protein
MEKVPAGRAVLPTSPVAGPSMEKCDGKSQIAAKGETE